MRSGLLLWLFRLLGAILKSRRAHSPHLPLGGTVDIRDRENQRFGLIVDGGVAESLGLAFVRHARFREVHLAHTETPWGIGVSVAQRSRTSAFGVEFEYEQTVEALEEFGVRQIVSLSHRVLQDPSTDQTSGPDVLTIGLQPFEACSRLLTAALDLASINEDVEGVFVRDEPELSDLVLLDESKAAQSFGTCSLLIEATTFRTDAESSASEFALARLLRAIPDAVSPLASCVCHTRGGAEPEKRAS
jgi:hypothetical protein